MNRKPSAISDPGSFTLLEPWVRIYSTLRDWGVNWLKIRRQALAESLPFFRALVSNVAI